MSYQVQKRLYIDEVNSDDYEIPISSSTTITATTPSGIQLIGVLSVAIVNSEDGGYNASFCMCPYFSCKSFSAIVRNLGSSSTAKVYVRFRYLYTTS